MIRFTPRRTGSILFLALLLIALLALAACSGDEEPTTTTEGATSSTSSGATTPTSGGETTTTPGSPTGESTPSASYEEQLPDLEEAVEKAPEDLEALQELAIGYYQTQRYDEAIETYLKMLEIEDSAVVHNNLGNVYRDSGKIEDAIAEYEKAIEIDPNAVLAYGNLATLYFTNGQPDEARQVLEDGLENASDDAKQQLQSLLDSMQ